MEIVRRSILDWEPLTVTLVLKDDAASGELRPYVERWLQSRDARHLCDCHTHYLSFPKHSTESEVVFDCEWMCDICLAALADSLHADQMEIDHIEIGLHSQPVPVMDDVIIEVPAKSIELEDGRHIEVDSFHICKCCVRIDQFRRFAAATGYRTIAEHDSFAGRSYLENELIAAGGQGDQTPAFLISFTDAAAYCVWARVELPTEEQWVAASLLDQNIYQNDDEYRQVYRKLMKRPDALDFGGNDWTSTTTPDGRHVLRGGPRLVRAPDWRHGRRDLRAVDDCDLLNTFRVCCRSGTRSPAQWAREK